MNLLIDAAFITLAEPARSASVGSVSVAPSPGLRGRDSSSRQEIAEHGTFTGFEQLPNVDALLSPHS